MPKTQQDLVNKILQAEIDILCVSLYVWNKEQVLKDLKGIKKLIGQPLVVITGGPESNPNLNNNFLYENPDVDFATYGQGEQAFVSILDHVINQKKLSILNDKNMAWRNSTGRFTLGMFQWINNKESSPYLESQHLLEQLANDTDLDGIKKVLPYETSRGCAYKCAFCDWTGGLSHKVFHRSFDIEQELDLFGRLGLTNIYLADANFGQHQQDKIIAQTMVRLKLEKNYNFKLAGQNWSKLKKSQVFEIIDIFAQADCLPFFKFAVQDTDAKVLSAIERPDIPWHEHKKLIINAVKKHPKIPRVVIELIQGLPGQTRQGWKNNFIECQGFDVVAYPFTVLSAAPVAYDKDYREKVQIKTKIINTPFINNFHSNCVIETFSYSFDDYVYFTLISSLMVSGRPFFMLDNRKQFFDLVDSDSKLSHTIDQGKNLMCDLNFPNDLFRSKWNNLVDTFAKHLVDTNLSFFPQHWIKYLDMETDFYILFGTQNEINQQQFS